MEFRIKMTFLHRNPSIRHITEKDGYTAITKALGTLSAFEKDNIKSVSII